MKKFLLLFLMIFLTSLGLSSCQLAEDYLDSQEDSENFEIYNKVNVVDKGPVEGGTLKLFSTVPDTLNPLLTHNTYVKRFLDLIYEGLVRIGKDQKPIPVLADSWQVSEDKLIYTFHIRQGVKWHDGTPLTAEDVEFTLDLITNTHIDSIYKENVENINTFAAVNRDTFRIALKKPNSFTPELMTFPIIPKNNKLTGDTSKHVEAFEPVGTGPYRFKEWEKGEHIVLTVNNEWWNSIKIEDTSLSTPFIHEIIINIFDSSFDEIEAFQSGDVDIANINSYECNKYKERADIILKKYPSRNFDFIAFNLNKPALKQREVRQAMMYALDKSDIINEVMLENVVSANFPLLPSTWLSGEENNSDLFDISKAKQILEEAGWKKGKNGLFKKIEGKTRYLKFELVVNEDNEYRTAAAKKISQQLKEIGISVEIDEVSWDKLIEKINKKDYDMLLTGCKIPSIPDISYMYSSSFISPYIAKNSDQDLNLAGYKNVEIDNYLHRIFSEDDSNLKKELFNDMKKIIIEDIPYIGLYFYNNGVIYHKNIRGEMLPYEWNTLNDITKWYIREG